MKKFIYADNAATTQLDIEAFEAMKPYLLNEYANASQPYSFSRMPKKALKESREIIAECIGANPEEIYFTSGGTESDNWAVKGSAFADIERRQTITSQIEHHAVLRSCKDIERLGYPVVYLPVNSLGCVQPDILSERINNRTRLVSIMLCNNEIGSIQDITVLSKIAHMHGAIFHTDAVQAVGHIPIDVNKIGVDMLSASAHKFNGPKGIGFLYIRKGTNINSYISGGGQERNLRAGTENIALIVGMAQALKTNVISISENIRHLELLEKSFLDALKEKNIIFLRNGSQKHIPGNISLAFPECEGEALLHRLDLMGICISTGSACDSKKTRISHVLEAIGLDENYAKGTIRISFGKNNTVEETRYIADAIGKIVQ